ncbi:MAG: hypothetical protein JO037_21670 [Actinobacteria bacterium]|nr:hypothetical protein [Actinomycetota bacterium]
MDVKTAARYIRAAQAAGLARDGDEAQLTDGLLGQVVAARGYSRKELPGNGAGQGAREPDTSKPRSVIKGRSGVRRPAG